LFLTHSAQRVDDQIKSIKSSGALAKEGIVANPPYGVRIGSSGCGSDQDKSLICRRKLA
jgi:23S rRNA G2445 N2-methylase RlmL